MLQFDGSASSYLSHRYLWTGVVDELIADETVGSGADTLYALGDHLGTISDIANFSGSTSTTTVTNRRTYNSFGKLTAETNAAVDLIFGYTGKQLDDGTGLQHNLFRWYDFALGQWLSEDPLGFAAGDENLKRYVGNGVISRLDPSGLDWLDAYANWFNSQVPGGQTYTNYAGGQIHSGVTYFIGNDAWATASATQLTGWTVAAAVPMAFGLLFGGEVLLGVGTAGALTTASFSFMVPTFGFGATGVSGGVLTSGWAWSSATMTLSTIDLACAGATAGLIYMRANGHFPEMPDEEALAKTGEYLHSLQEAWRQFWRNKAFHNYAHKGYMEKMKMGGGGVKNPDIPKEAILALAKVGSFGTDHECCVINSFFAVKTNIQTRRGVELLSAISPSENSISDSGPAHHQARRSAPDPIYRPSVIH